MTEFVKYPKTPRLFRDVVITEKIDGTNAAIGITEAGDFWTQSRNRIITPKDDNAGFARWAWYWSDVLANLLGPGVHFGEWWGSGIQRGYGLVNGERRFSLFNVSRWEGADLSAVPWLGVVPVLYQGVFSDYYVERTLDELALDGSRAKPGFMDPEGVCVFHTASRQVYKVLLENDSMPKTLAAVA